MEFDTSLDDAFHAGTQLQETAELTADFHADGGDVAGGQPEVAAHFLDQVAVEAHDAQTDLGVHAEHVVAEPVQFGIHHEAEHIDRSCRDFAGLVFHVDAQAVETEVSADAEHLAGVVDVVEVQDTFGSAALDGDIFTVGNLFYKTQIVDFMPVVFRPAGDGL